MIHPASELLVGRVMKVQYGDDRWAIFANHEIVNVTLDGDNSILWFNEGRDGNYGIAYGAGIEILPEGSPLLDKALNTEYVHRPAA